MVAGCDGGSPSGKWATERPLGALVALEPAGSQEVWVVGDDAQTLTSRWFLALDGSPVTLSLTSDLDGTHASGSAIGDDGAVDVVDAVTWDAATGVLDFRRRLAGGVRGNVGGRRRA